MRRSVVPNMLLRRPLLTVALGLIHTAGLLIELAGELAELARDARDPEWAAYKRDVDAEYWRDFIDASGPW